MVKISLKSLFVTVAIVSVMLVPISLYIRHSGQWAPVEKAADMLQSLVCHTSSTSKLSVDVVNKLLDRPQYEFLKLIRSTETELRPGELVWFSPHVTYSIGSLDDGSRIWLAFG